MSDHFKHPIRSILTELLIKYLANTRSKIIKSFFFLTLLGTSLGKKANKQTACCTIKQLDTNSQTQRETKKEGNIINGSSFVYICKNRVMADFFPTLANLFRSIALITDLLLEIKY